MERRKKKKPNKKLILILDGVLILAVLAAGTILIVSLSGGRSAKQETAAPSQQNSLSEGNADPTAPAAQGGQTASPVIWNGEAEPPLTVDFSLLKAANSEVAAWLYQKDTAINFAVMQNIDNDYYLSRNADGKKDKSGAICLDSRNSAAFLDSHIVLYGNAMADGSMFGSLVEYRNQEYLAAHPSLYLITPEKSFRIDVFAAYTGSTSIADYPIWFEDKSARTAYLSAIRKESLISSDVAVGGDDQIISLATNVTKADGTRFVVCGVLIPV